MKKKEVRIFEMMLVIFLNKLGIKNIMKKVKVRESVV